VLADALKVTLPHRRFRDADARLFAGSGPARSAPRSRRRARPPACRSSRRTTSDTGESRSCTGRSWAEVARFVGQRKLSITADTYTHVLVDEREVGYATRIANGD
jgi:hypothetical protein